MCYTKFNILALVQLNWRIFSLPMWTLLVQLSPAWCPKDNLIKVFAFECKLPASIFGVLLLVTWVALCRTRWQTKPSKISPLFSIYFLKASRYTANSDSNINSSSNDAICGGFVSQRIWRIQLNKVHKFSLTAQFIHSSIHPFHLNPKTPTNFASK